MIPQPVYDIASSVLLIAGALLSLAAGIGLLRFPDALSRMHAATKPQIFGLILVLAAIALDQHTVGTIASLLVVLVFQMLTAPISAHMIGRAGYRNGDLRRDQLVVDELDEAVARAAGELAETVESDDADIDVTDLPVGSADALAVEMDRVEGVGDHSTADGDGPVERDSEGLPRQAGDDRRGGSDGL
ncbi:monovalent cation/H(+) antiporter subunit G [Frigoribacterium sp. CFBP 13712]|uniref:monovalent cation/H(+) antiporter subunit G n=1 Tax=Frigoribacterium sp. CFBP 13712 TaxID=2775309 RepID=UPI001784764A|nr:monovalent cation/H(+) antiporter subunit G [Frigoribacterium sp. CFBP 13712]MBD8702417.1 monovalent cation/H(+) antiporter subunit G [Frigoribacterium sp. CFBP 13712]